MTQDEKEPTNAQASSALGAETAPAEAELDDVESLRQALAVQKSRAEDLLAKWQRSQADFINYKRRNEQERSDATKYANAMLVLNLLPVMDDLERALNNISTQLAGLTWVDGIVLIYRKLLATLEAHGLSRIESVGRDFDPNLHEAIMYGEGAEGKVIEELQKGYRLHDRVIRPAMVKVGQGTRNGGREA